MPMAGNENELRDPEEWYFCLFGGSMFHNVGSSMPARQKPCKHKNLANSPKCLRKALRLTSPPRWRVGMRHLATLVDMLGKSVRVDRINLGTRFKRSCDFGSGLYGLCHESYQTMRLLRIRIDFPETWFSDRFWVFQKKTTQIWPSVPQCGLTVVTLHTHTHTHTHTRTLQTDWRKW